jgi:hypothetical protein
MLASSRGEEVPSKAYNLGYFLRWQAVAKTFFDCSARTAA